MKRSSMRYMIGRGISAIALALYFRSGHPQGMALWIRLIFVILILVPVTADTYRTYKFYQQNIKPNRSK